MDAPKKLGFVPPHKKPYLHAENRELMKIIEKLHVARLLNHQQMENISVHIESGDILSLTEYTHPDQRPDTLSKLDTVIGKTRTEVINLSNSNSLKITYESENPFGSHYDRVYLRLFKDFLNSEKADKDIIEISSGNAGVSSTVIALLFGKKISIVIPRTAYRIRETLLQRLGATVYVSPQSKGLLGSNQVLKQLLEKNSSEGTPSWFLNHSHVDASLEAVAPIAEGNKDVDYFFSAMGNGTSLRGIGERFRGLNPKIKIIGVRFPQKLQAFQKMLMPGGDQVAMSFPHLEAFTPDGIEWVDLDLVHQRSQNEGLGLTSAMVKIAVDQFIKREDITDKKFFVIDYDHVNRYAG